MKGTIVATWINTCKKLYGEDIVYSAMESVSWNKNKIFTPLENVEDAKVNKLIEFISQKRGAKLQDTWKEIGMDNIYSFHKYFPSFFQQENLYSFLKSLFDIHISMTKKFPGAKPPLVGIYPISKREAVFTYKSPRAMFDYCLGLLEGAGKFFNEKIDINILSKTEDSLEVRISFTKDIYYNKKYQFNKLMSFGFIKSIPAKIFMFTFIFGTALEYVIFQESIIKSFVGAFLISALSFISSHFLLEPHKIIKKEIKSLCGNKFYEDGHIETGDFFQDMYSDIISLKENIKKDFVGFKGVTDEMSTFVSKINDISDSMESTSNEISGVVEQVAEGAVSQAEDTENSAAVLKDNIDALKNIVIIENKNKKELEKAIEKINNSYMNVEKSSSNIKGTMENFKIVSEEARALQDNAKNITQIVGLVSGISDKTNLLALNASIEAARAGEQGKGFAVVSDEVRKLANDTKEAVESINGRLTKFTTDIEDLVNKIDEQFIILKEETINLSKVKDISYEATNSTYTVSKSMIDTVNELNKEAFSINTICDKIESLAAIAEENSASSEEVSADVTTYIGEIKKLTMSIHEFKKISEDFKKDLSKYKI